MIKGPLTKRRIQMAKGQISVGHDKFLIYACGIGAGYGGTPTNRALKEIQDDLNAIGQNVNGYRWMRTFNAMRYWLPTSSKPVRPRMFYRVALSRLTDGEIKPDDWDKVIRYADTSPWYPGMQ